MPRSRPHPTTIFPPPRQSFITKKARILESLSVPEDAYTDKSPKGSVDAPIVGLIDEINAIDGLVTTSSCSGRVAVFVEGSRMSVKGGRQLAEEDGEAGDGDGDEQETNAVTGSPAGKGGGRWLYVSHDPVSIPESASPGFFTKLCGFSEPGDATQSSLPASSKVVPDKNRQALRLIKLSFSPLILHVHCATLAHARPLLTASINSGFRESGVQSLKALDDPDAGVTMGIRTAGLGFETVIGVVHEGDGGDDQGVDDQQGERYERIVSEEYLRAMFDVINERFEWNERRRSRLMEEIRRGFSTGQAWEDSETRRRRKREEGLRRQREGGPSVGRDGLDLLPENGNKIEAEATGVGGLFEDKT